MVFNHTSTTTITTFQTLGATNDLGFVGELGSIVVSGNGVLMTGLSASLTNQGSIIGSTTGVQIGNVVRVVNAGTISGASQGILVQVNNVTSNDSHIFNSGEILSTNNHGIHSLEAGIDVHNSGLIAGAGFGIFINSTDLGFRSDITNTGTISSLSATAISCGGTIKLVNTGTIAGAVLFAGGNDLIDTRIGRIQGEIQMGDGNNTLRGGVDSDSVSSGTGADQLSVGLGDDEVSSGSGADILRGGEGEDTLNGGANDDDLFGGRGADVLEGGTGADDMTGGADADLFVFRNTSDSPVFDVADQILDFQRGLDLIEISSLLPTVVTFVGQNAFTGGGTASVRFVKSVGFVTLLADADGNGTADFHLEVFGVAALGTSDLILA